MVAVGELEAEMGGHFEVEAVVEVKAKAETVVDKVEAEEVGMVVVEEAADTEAHHVHIVAEGDEDMTVGAEKLAQVQQSEMQQQDKEMIMRARRREQRGRHSIASHA